MRDDFYVEVRDLDSATGVAPRPALGPLAARMDELGEAITSTTTRLRGQLDHDLGSADGKDWRVDTIEISFQLDLRPGDGVVLARPGDRYAVSVKVAYKHKSSA